MKTCRFAFVQILRLSYLSEYEVDQERGGGELSLSVCPGVGNRPPRKKKNANPRGCARGGGGMITCKIELEPIPTCWGQFFPFVFVFLQLLVMVYSFSFRSPVFC